jgi:hypothetical protein
MLHEINRLVRRFVHWLFGAPFEDLPPAFGEPMPEIRAFEEEMEEAQHHRTRGSAPTLSVRRYERDKPAR